MNILGCFGCDLTSALKAAGAEFVLPLHKNICFDVKNRRHKHRLSL